MNSNKINKFLLLTSTLSIIILLLGATFSYFTINATSKADVLAVQAGQIKLGLGVSPLYAGYDLIPLKDEYINKAYQQKCKDDYGNGACLAYTLEIFNYSNETEVEGFIDFTIEDIENLSYMVLDENDNVYLDKTSIDSSNSTNLTLGSPLTLASAPTGGSSTTKLTLLIWLSDNNLIQDETDASGKFSAVVTFTSSSAGRLTATVEGMESDAKTTSIID